MDRRGAYYKMVLRQMQDQELEQPQLRENADGRVQPRNDVVAERISMAMAVIRRFGQLAGFRLRSTSCTNPSCRAAFASNCSASKMCHGIRPRSAAARTAHL
jgi:hypothetical protein